MNPPPPLDVDHFSAENPALKTGLNAETGTAVMFITH